MMLGDICACCGRNNFGYSVEFVIVGKSKFEQFMYR